MVAIGGGYAAISRLGQSTSSSSSAAPASSPVAVGPKVTYGHWQSINAIKSNTDFVPASMRNQVDTALASEHKPASITFGAPAHVPAAGTNAVPWQPASAQMDGCVNRVAADQNVRLVEIARYQGKQAWIIAVTVGPGQAKAGLGRQHQLLGR